MFSRFAGRRSVGFLLMLATVSSVGGCSAAAGAAAVAATSSPTSPKVVAVDCPAFEAQAQVAQDVHATTGQQIVLRLCSNPSTGFGWQAAGIPAGIVRLVDQSSELAATNGGSGQAGLVGAPGVEVLTFDAAAAGTGDLQMLYSQPWAGGTKGTWQLTVHVVVD